MVKSYVQDPATGKLVPKEEYRPRSAQFHYVLGDVDPFVSPVDGSVINSRADLRAHNAKHGVTDSRDYSREFMLSRSAERINRITGNTREDRNDRKQLIARAMEKRND